MPVELGLFFERCQCLHVLGCSELGEHRELKELEKDLAEQCRADSAGVKQELVFGTLI